MSGEVSGFVYESVEMNGQLNKTQKTKKKNLKRNKIFKQYNYKWCLILQ